MRTLNLLTRGAAAVALALMTAPATAQTNNQSDVTGGNVTSSAIAGGGTVAAEASPAVAAAVANAGTAVTAQLSSGTLSATTPDGATVSIPPAVQAALLGILAGGAAPPEFVAGLAASGAGAASELAQALENLVSSPATGQLAAAVGHFNALVAGADPAFLASPTPEFLAVHSVLSQLVAAGRGAG